eukprot:6178652-Pleurochrysis_carterae.AAC.9
MAAGTLPTQPRAGGFSHDHSVYGKLGYGAPKRKAFSHPGDADHRKRCVLVLRITPSATKCSSENVKYCYCGRAAVLNDNSHTWPAGLS